jgi:polyhydroxyalkanoate synthesis regulator phasin
LDTQELFNTAIYGSSFNLKPRHYVYKGHLKDEEFKSHMKTLMEWKQETEAFPEERLSKDDDARELQIAMGKLIDQVKEIRGLAEEQQAAISSLRDQFFKLKDA